MHGGGETISDLGPDQWVIYHMGDSGPSLLPPGSREVAGLFRNGDLLLGCEDQFPTLGIVARNGASATFPSNIALNNQPHVITLATYDEAVSWKSQLESRYNVDPDWWGTVDSAAAAASHLAPTKRGPASAPQTRGTYAAAPQSLRATAAL